MYEKAEALPNHGRRVGKYVRKVLASLSIVSAGLLLSADTRLPETRTLLQDEQVIFHDDEVVLMTANVHGWIGRVGHNLDNFLGMLEENQPDIACLQEVYSDAEGHNWFRNPPNTVLKRIRDAGYNIIFAPTKNHIASGPFGNALISPFEITPVDVARLPTNETRTPRNVLFAELETTNGPVLVGCTHLSIDQAESLRQANYIADKMSPVLIAADLNRRPEDAAATDLMQAFGRILHAQVIESFPAHQPRIQIDYVASRCDVDTSKLNIYTRDFNSDHLAVIGRFAIHC